MHRRLNGHQFPSRPDYLPGAETISRTRAAATGAPCGSRTTTGLLNHCHEVVRWRKRLLREIAARPGRFLQAASLSPGTGRPRNNTSTQSLTSPSIALNRCRHPTHRCRHATSYSHAVKDREGSARKVKPDLRELLGHLRADKLEGRRWTDHHLNSVILPSSSKVSLSIPSTCLPSTTVANSRIATRSSGSSSWCT